LIPAYLGDTAITSIIARSEINYCKVNSGFYDKESMHMPIKKLRITISAIAISLMIFSSTAAGASKQVNQDTWQQLSPSLRIGGSARYRYETKQDFQFGAPTAANSQDYWLQQLRLHMLWQVSSNVSLFLEGQDARIFQGFSGHVINNRKTPNIFEDHLDIHQAYLDIKTHAH
jgi:hypothetical protein